MKSKPAPTAPPRETYTCWARVKRGAPWVPVTSGRYSRQFALDAGLLWLRQHNARHGDLLTLPDGERPDPTL